MDSLVYLVFFLWRMIMAKNSKILPVRVMNKYIPKGQDTCSGQKHRHIPEIYSHILFVHICIILVCGER